VSQHGQLELKLLVNLIGNPDCERGAGERKLARTFLALLAVVVASVIVAGAAAAKPQTLRVIATNLNNPRKLFVAADGTVYVAEAGSGGASCFTNGSSKTCTGTTSSVTEIAKGTQHRVVTGLPSAASTDGSDAEGAADVIVANGRYDVLLGNGRVGADRNSKTEITGDLITTPAGKVDAKVLANFGAYEAAHNPDHGAGPGAAAGDPPLDSNPYAMVAYRGGYAVVDAAGNDLLWLSPKGKLSVLAVFPTRVEQKIVVQSVPTSVAVGPDGALYVGELTGYPFEVGKARVWRVVPGQKPKVYAAGFTNISDLAFDGKTLYVLEIAAKGLRDASSPGALIRVTPSGRRSVILSAGLSAPTGLAIHDGVAYVSNYGTSPATGKGHRGEVVSFRL
jgi:glucose/arabinose dehydrogenase